MPTFLLEIGTEELPAEFVKDALAQWQEYIPVSLKENFLTPTSIEFFGSPRRLGMSIQGLNSQQADREEEIKGPPAQGAFKDGKPTPAAIGFVRKQEVSLESLEIRDTEKGPFVFVQKKIPGQPTGKLLQRLIPQWITKLQGKRFMRWADGELRFPRPIRSLVALLDQELLEVELVNGSGKIESDRLTTGHRVLHPAPVTINAATDYLQALKNAYVEVNPRVRRDEIEAQIQARAASLGATAIIPPDLLEEVTNLVEWPTAIVGSFDSQFLNLPPEVITTVMVTHQRYFPLQDPQANLLPQFITIGNGDPAKSEIIASGNERVIRARLADAEFFYQTDCDEHLESYLPQLETVTFQEELGSMRDKVDRIIEISQQIVEQLQLDSQQRNEIESTALLCKADLVTQMVYEFPELQGIMGEKYARVSGESESVAMGIFEHYLPRGAEDIMPQSLNGQVVGLADRLDTLVNIFGLGLIPTGSSDPFALRRAANAIVLITWHAQLQINLAELLDQIAQDFVNSHPEKESPLSLLQDFFIQRIRTLLQDDLKIDYDLVNAVLPDADPEYSQRALTDLLDVRDRALFLQQIRQNGLLAQIYETINRSTRLAVKGDLDTVSLSPERLAKPELFEKSSESAFYQALLDLVPTTAAAQKERNYQLLVDALAQINPIVSHFFDGEDSVLIMADNPEIRQNRLNLLSLLRNHARILADFGSIVKS
ncbi:glycine--tRNA ligase subunit beta [Gloeocapsa sp. PCC 73106]|uniref:glycine--tRNA ligase subunit beta n=1 Tax=Gloeocapsa sp. PCC 73106 TaxID=102232 RepID=UPI0002AC9679|nr:glycine--tRNA ligase subunit beta [Gloeocapsa sp. PCC 73106]ELR97910.1 glycyl-tRNA synthetase beta chain [Gloeocapsa sp. PCC 73106]